MENSIFCAVSFLLKSSKIEILFPPFISSKQPKLQDKKLLCNKSDEATAFIADMDKFKNQCAVAGHLRTLTLPHIWKFALCLYCFYQNIFTV